MSFSFTLFSLSYLVFEVVDCGEERFFVGAANEHFL